MRLYRSKKKTRFFEYIFAMTYAQTIDYLFQQLPMFTRVGASAYRKDLNNTLALCATLGEPQDKFPTIHIGGTNGKGSVAHMIAAILQAAGFKTGLYISPHFKDFRERIKINGEMIPKRRVVSFVEQQKPDFEKIQPSFFEMTVAMAFDYFHTEGVDVAVIEVGLGGRLDSTNVITPEMSIITNISYDHMDILGDTLEKIAYEKAGIIKKNVPIVIGEWQVETEPVFIKKAEVENAPITFASERIDIQRIANDFEFSTFNIHFKNGKKLNDLRVDLAGDYQTKNIATVLQAVEVLNVNTRFKINETALRAGLENVKSLAKLMGRWEVISREPMVLVESAHNEGGMTLAMQQLKALTINHLHIVFGVVRDKEISKILALLPTDATYYFAKANIPRGLEAETLQAKAIAYGLKGKTYTSVSRALMAAKRRAKTGDLVYVGGSMFVVAEVI